MRYFCSDMGAPKPWQDTEETNEYQVIDTYIHEEMWVWDSDSCGDETVYFSFSTGRHFKVVYSWWISYEPDWTLHHDIAVEEIEKSQTEGICSDRDWMHLPFEVPGKTRKAWNLLQAQVA